MSCHVAFPDSATNETNSLHRAIRVYGGNDYDFLFKIVITGDSGTGKTALLGKFVGEEHSGIATIGVDFKIRTVDIDGKRVKLQIVRV